MKFFLISIFSSLLLFSSEVDMKLYSGHIDMASKYGYYNGALIRSYSEDETIKFEFGLKDVQIKDMKYSQNETYISVENELNLQTIFKFSYLNINEKQNGGNLYMFGLNNELDSGLEIDTEFGYLNYNLNKVYQTQLSMKNFLYNSNFYYDSMYILNIVDDIDRYKYYHSLNLELGFIYKKYQLLLSSYLGKKRYTMDTSKYFSFNFGNTYTDNFNASFIYQFRRDTLISLDYLYSKIYNTNSSLKVLNLAVVIKF